MTQPLPAGLRVACEECGDPLVLSTRNYYEAASQLVANKWSITNNRGALEATCPECSSFMVDGVKVKYQDIVVIG